MYLFLLTVALYLPKKNLHLSLKVFYTENGFNTPELSKLYFI